VIRDLVAGKWLRAVSLSWQPIEYKRSSSPDIHAIFTEVDMLEVSVVPLPALADALLAARSWGLDVRPLAQWAERKLDTGNYRAVPRPQLEAIARAASQARLPRSPSSSSSSTRAARVARAREILDNGTAERRDRARAIVARVAQQDAGLTVGLTKENDLEPKKSMREAHSHLQRSLKRHRELAGHLDDLGAEATKLREVKRGVTNTLTELGIQDERVDRALKELDRCGRAIRRAHGGAEDSGISAAGAVDQAADCVSTAMANFK
jgi:hypothetical protein